MSRSVGLAHIIRGEDGTSTGVWGVFTIRSAFQPIFAFEEGKLVVRAFEGLLRPFRDGEAISPPAFFAAISPRDRFHVETLARTLHLLNAPCLDPAAALFLNFDPSLFSDEDVTATVLRDMRLLLHETGIDPRRIVCEMTEQRSSSGEALFRFVEALRGCGFRIAVDDYGADDSDIRRIEEIRPDVVKFDASWVVRLMDSGPGQALLAAMVHGFTDRGIATVFEGIEEARHLELAERCEVTMVQGFALARPELAPTRFSSFTRQEAGPVRRPAVEGREPAARPAPLARRFPLQARPFGRRQAGR